MYYVELSISHPLEQFTALARTAGATVKVLMTDPKWTTTTVRLFSDCRVAVEATLATHFIAPVASMHSAAIRIGQ